MANSEANENIDSNVQQNDGGDEESDDSDEENLFGERAERDYGPAPELDHYDQADIDDDTVSEMSIGQRFAAEASLDQRDHREARRGRTRRGLDLLDDTSEADSQMSSTHGRKRRRFAENAPQGQTAPEPETEIIENLDDTRGMSSKEWVSQRATRNEIRYRFKFLLKTHVDENGRSVFKEKIRTMALMNYQSFELDYTILAKEQPAIAIFLVEVPDLVLPVFNEGAKEVVLSMYPGYKKIADTINVRIENLALTEEIRALRLIHLNQLIRTQGVVSSATSIIPQLSLVKFNCLKCFHLFGPFVQQQNTEIEPGRCPNCQSLGKFDINMKETLFNNYQRLTIQEMPGKVSAGRVPRTKDVILLGDLCGACRPGDEIDLTGVYSNTYDGALNISTGFPVFATVIMANNVTKKHDWTSINQTLTDADVRQIVDLSKKPDIVERIVASICPSIYGHKDVKRAIAMSLFGGCSKIRDQHRIRGDINVLLCGDPGTAKSQFLKYTLNIAPKAVYTTGQGASGVGLTAYVQKSPLTNEWTLEGGAFVLADKGVCLIDEFDKMSDKDRTSIHEAMEQQTISVSKAGIVATLHARCAVIAASNPVGGRYNGALTFSQNVDLTGPIISRFDIICVVRDLSDQFNDSKLARFIVRSHIRSHHKVKKEEIASLDELENQDKLEEYELIDQDLLRKYIIYARERYKPKMTLQQQERISKIYAELRQQASLTNSIPVTARHLESIIRCAESYAKMHLRNFVSTDDENVAIKVILEGFISTQKNITRRNMQSIFRTQLSYKRSAGELMLDVLKTMVLREQAFMKEKYGRDTPVNVVEIDEKEFRQKCRRIDDSDPSHFYRTPMFSNNSFTYETTKRIIRYTRVNN